MSEQDRYMPSFSAQSSIVIHKPLNDVMAVISNFQTWPTWSPWLVMEPKCRVTYHGDMGTVGSSYHWQGSMIGAGEMRLTSLSEHQLGCQLGFLKPYKSTAQVGFELSETEHGTRVTWTLDSSVPWFMFWLAQSMSQMISMDYQRGLLMLKSLLEHGKVPSQLIYLGDQTASSIWYVGVEASGTLEQLSSIMAKDFTRLTAYFDQHQLHATGKPFSLYFSMDNGICQLHNCLPVAQQLAVEPPFICQQLPTKETHCVRHIGAYPLIGNAWAFAMMTARHHKVKTTKSPLGLERYMSDPRDIAPDERICEVALFKR